MSQTADNLTPWFLRMQGDNADLRRARFSKTLSELGAVLEARGWELPEAHDLTDQATAVRAERLESFLAIVKAELLPVRAGDGDTDAVNLPSGPPARVPTLRPLRRLEVEEIASAGFPDLPDGGDIA